MVIKVLKQLCTRFDGSNSFASLHEVQVRRFEKRLSLSSAFFLPTGSRFSPPGDELAFRVRIVFSDFCFFHSLSVSSFFNNPHSTESGVHARLAVILSDNVSGLEFHPNPAELFTFSSHYSGVGLLLGHRPIYTCVCCCNHLAKAFSAESKAAMAE